MDNKSLNKGTHGTVKKKGMYKLKGHELDSRFRAMALEVKGDIWHLKINDD